MVLKKKHVDGYMNIVDNICKNLIYESNYKPIPEAICQTASGIYLFIIVLLFRAALFYQPSAEEFTAL